ncbi:hypothetical protein K2173_017998 [Erythroxylum novogranatense]|uniref:Glutaredoxin domain-containing protein n=1 Tax=Erythroxylum novogranatense TaxID=1862640 RepID=A0AAV8TUF3_9ROSI|nr:hypothetical protein K2173_017998 [Erythroxylum novogranatense]
MENKVNDSSNSIKLIQTLELQVKGNIWTPSSSSSQGIRIETLDSLLNMLKLQAHPSSSSLSLESNTQTCSIYLQDRTYQQNEGSKIARTPSGSVQKISYPTTGELYLPAARGTSSSFFLSGTENRIVLYFTSSQLIRRTYDNCHEVRMIFRALQVLVDERNTDAMPEYTKELKSVLKQNFSLPQVFIKGKCIGGVDVIKEMNENGKLRSLVEGFPVRNRPSYCNTCGEVTMVDCPYCKSGKNCSKCEGRGMIPCPACQS